ncbi:MAG: glycoside hydrolase family 92 protein [Haliscomenobacter sp.]|nr:glycoside hydrolase family 92 protein [Haliscomenobacter sp.]
MAEPSLSKTTFYTALYRLFCYSPPASRGECPGRDRPLQPVQRKGTLPGYLYTDNGFWDTFRAVFPFFNVMYRGRNSQIMQGLVNTYKGKRMAAGIGRPGHRDCMIGSNSAPYCRCLPERHPGRIQTLYEAILKNTPKTKAP